MGVFFDVVGQEEGELVWAFYSSVYKWLGALGVSWLLLDFDVFDASELLDLGADKDQLNGQHHVVVADFFQIFVVSLFIPLGGEVSLQEWLILDFGAEEGDLSDFAQEVNLNQRHKSVLASVKAELDSEESVELDQWQFFGRCEDFMERSYGLVDPVPNLSKSYMLCCWH